MSTPEVTSLSPSNGANVEHDNAGDSLSITFSEAIYASATRLAFNAARLANLVELKLGGSSGTDVDAALSISRNYRTVTVNPDADLAPGSYSFGVSSSYWGSAGLKGQRALHHVHCPRGEERTRHLCPQSRQSTER